MTAIVATTPAEMQAAQATTLQWVENKIAASKKELALAHSVFNSLHKNGLRTQNAQSQIKKANKRVEFYEKVKAALNAGYYIIPPFNVQLFSIRVPEKSNPRGGVSESRWQQEQEARSLPIGTGKYVDPHPDRVRHESITRIGNDGQERSVTLYKNDEWKDHDLPVLAHRPEIIDAVGKAWQLKIFDALGIAPAYRSADPIIVGQIKHWKANSNPLTFFVAWWLDESDL